MGKPGKRKGGTALQDIRSVLPLVDEVNGLEEEMRKTVTLESITSELVDEVRASGSPDDALRERQIQARAAAAVREAGRRAIGLRHYDVQVAGGLALAERRGSEKGSIVEMRTGEGKTLTATVPLYLSSLAGKGSWLLTVNDYLARRDAEWMGPVFSELGRTVGVLQPTTGGGVTPSYVYDSDEQYAALASAVHSVIKDKSAWDAKRQAFTSEGLQALVEKGVLTEEFVESGALGTLARVEGLLAFTRTSNKDLPREVAEKMPFISEMDEWTHFSFDPATQSIALTDRGIALLKERGALTLPEDMSGVTPRWKDLPGMGWQAANGLLFEEMPHLRLASRKEAYAADITYGPSAEFVFDWLRDKHMARRREDQAQRPELPGFVLVDEVDYILIDDARTPHILSGNAPSPYGHYAKIVPALEGFVGYEYNATRFSKEVERCARVSDLFVDSLIPLGQDPAKKEEFDALLAEFGIESPVTKAYAAFKEGVHWGRTKNGKVCLTKEGYSLLKGSGAVPFAFDIGEMRRNQDPEHLASLLTMTDLVYTAKHHLDNEVHYIYNPKTEELWLTALGDRTLQERGAVPAEDIIHACETATSLITEELLPLRSSKRPGDRERLEAILDEQGDESLAKAFKSMVPGYHFTARRLSETDAPEYELTEQGLSLLQHAGVIPHPSVDGQSVGLRDGATTLLRARTFHKRGEKYAVADTPEGKQIVLVDEHSGRLLHGRRLKDGLHEAIEALEGIPIQKGMSEAAQISQQMFCEMMPWLAGMSGTAASAWRDFRDTYKLDVKVLPTNIQWRWLTGELEQRIEKLDSGIGLVTYTDEETGEKFYERADHPHFLVGAFSEKDLQEDPALAGAFSRYKAVVEAIRSGGRGTLPDELAFDEVQFTHYYHLLRETLDKAKGGRPVLLHTVDPNVSAELGAVLESEARLIGMPLAVNVLYHQNHDKEAAIVREAGCQDTVTIATNMAGRGVDIKLSPEARQAGGLHIVRAQGSESVRDEDQINGRAARQGDPGSSVAILSVLDPYLKPFGGEQLLGLLSMLGEGDPTVSDPRLSSIIEAIQGQIEERHREVRKKVLDYDRVLDAQRKAFIGQRERVMGLSPEETREAVLGIYDDTLNAMLDKALTPELEVDNHAMSLLFSQTGAYAPDRERVKGLLADEDTRASIRESYLNQIGRMLSNRLITPEESGHLEHEVDAALENGTLPPGAIVLRPLAAIDLPLNRREIGEARKTKSHDEFFDWLEQHAYSKALFTLVEAKAISWQEYDRARTLVKRMLDSQREETRDGTVRPHLETRIPKDMPVGMPYAHAAALEAELRGKSEDEVFDTLKSYVAAAYDARCSPEDPAGGAREHLLSTLDLNWSDHLSELDTLHSTRRFSGGKDPLTTYTDEASKRFTSMMQSAKEEFAAGRTGYFSAVRPKRPSREGSGEDR